MNTLEYRRIQFAHEGGQGLPLAVDSIGYNPEQERVVRREGYPTYHWIQTLEGSGALSFEERTYLLTPGSGVLLLPGVPHEYEAENGRWSTYYITFAGASAEAILKSLGVHLSAFYQWERESPLEGLLESMLRSRETAPDMFGLDSSTEVYRFLLTLSKYGRLQNNTAVSRNLLKLRPLLEWMEANYGDPSIGLEDLASQLGVSGRYLNALFLQTFNLSPYAYFVRLRIRKAKELLVRYPDQTVKAISALAGFRDASHFVATFRRQSGTTPEQFRRLH